MPITSRPSNYNLRSQGEAPGILEPVQIPEPVQVNNLDNQGFPPILRNNMAGVFRLENFKGDGSQKVESYLKRFDQFRTCTGLNNEQALATLAWHLEGTARLWFEHLNPEPRTVEELKAAMVVKFARENVVNMSVYAMKQSAGESVEDFLHRLEAETFKTNISHEIQVQIALNGMDRAIGSAISTHAPKTLDEVKRLTFRANYIRQQDVPVVAQATTSTKLENTIEVLTAAVAKLAASVEQPPRRPNPMTDHGRRDEPIKECSRCGGRCYSMSSCKAMGKTCYKCKKLNHFGNKCTTVRRNGPQSPQPRQHQSYRHQYESYPK